MTRIERACARELCRKASGYSLLLSANPVKCRGWTSALFAGVRLTFAISADDDDKLDAWLADLPEFELSLPGHFVADAEVIERNAKAATIELLLIEG
jgi:hypothetical protein